MRRIFGSKSVMIMWAVSYLLILIIPIILNTISYVQIEKNLIDEVHGHNMSIIKGKIQSVDNAVGEIVKLSMEFAGNSRVRDIIKYPKAELSPQNKYEIYKLSADFNARLQNLSYVKNIYIYFNNIDIIVSPVGMTEPKDFYNKITNKVSFETWQSELSGHYFGNYIKNSNLYAFSVAQAGMKEINANIFIEYNLDDLTTVVTADLKRNMNGFALFDTNNTIITEYGEPNILEIVSSVNLADKKELLDEKHKNKKYVISKTVSPQSRLTYVYVVDEDSFLDKVKYIRWFNIINMMVCLIIGNIIIFYLLKKNYAPIGKLVTQLRSMNHIDISNNEFQFINNSILKLVDEKQNMMDKLSLQDNVIQESIIQKLLKGTDFGKAPAGELLNSIGIDFNNNCFLVMIFYVEDIENIFFEQEPKNGKYDLKLSQIIISNIVEELLDANGNHAVSCYMDNLLCEVINIQETQSMETILKAINEAKKMINQQFNYDFIVAVSDIHQSLDGIAICYNEAITCLEHRFLLWDVEFIKYSDIYSENSNSYYYPLDEEQKFINLLKTGDYEACRKLIDEIFAANFDKRTISIHLAKCLMFDLLSTIIKTVMEIGIPDTVSFLDEFSPLERIMKCDTAILMKEEITAFLKELCDYIEKKSVNISNKISDKVFKYIEQNYNDINLNVATISEHFSINANYLSTLFKQQNNIGLLEYITKVRVNKAKEIMAKQNITLMELCDQLGYANIRTFSRVFTKHTGISPGKYMDMNMGANNES